MFTYLQLCLVILYCLNTLKADDDDHDAPPVSSEGPHESKCGGNEPSVVPANYDKTETGLHGRALDVGLKVYVESIIRIDITAMEFSVRCYIIHVWNDQRLARSRHHVVIRTDATPFWVPDTYCLNCRESIVGENARQLIRVDTDGRVFFSQLSQLYASCIMNLERFPFDIQTCRLKFSSYSLNNSYINFYWKPGLTIERMVLDQFTVRNTSVMHSSVVLYAQGNFTILEAEVYFERQMGFYIMQFMVPSICLVFLSWVTLYMSPNDVGDRVAIGVTLILTMIFMLGYVNNNLPKVAYIKAIDWFLIVSLAMIILSVLESAIVYWVHNNKEPKSDQKQKRLCNYTDKLRCSPPDMHQVKINLLENCNIKSIRRRHTTDSIGKSKKKERKSGDGREPRVNKNVSVIDNIARAVLPLIYILYTTSYMYTYSKLPQPVSSHK